MPKRIAALLIGLLCLPAFADEGMWTYHDFPQAQIKQRFGVDISQAWLDRARMATVRLSGCTASFVSSEGLILTNHHCADSCLDENSTSTQNLERDGFLAGSREKELRCTTQIADVLMATENITDKITAGTRNLPSQAANEARKKLLTQLEQRCEHDSAKAKTGPLKCESVNLYQGGQYWLYEYKRYDDVRLVFAPEEDIAAFGGDRTTSGFRAGTSTCRCCERTTRTGNPPSRPPSCASAPKDPSPAKSCSFRDIRAQPTVF
jgi:Peptidase S46